MENADIIVVGGGSAGAAVAARLSEEPRLRVLLIEAGPDIAPGHVPADIADTFPSAYFNRGYFWPGVTTTLTEGDRLRPFPQPRLIGGGSNVMGMIALRGLPGDYDDWVGMGAAGWSWDEVAPFFHAMTRDLDRPMPERNEQAPNIIRRLPREIWPLYMRKAEEALAARGVASHANVNATSADGFFATPLSHDGERASSSRCYLTNEVRARENFEILPHTRVRSLLFHGNRVTGVVVERDGAARTIGAREVVVCAGGIHSPAVLLRAGIGPADELKRLGIAPVADRPGVGRNFQNHVQLHFALVLTPRSQLAPQRRHYAMTAVRASSNLPDCPKGDLFLYLTGRVSNRAFGTRMALIAAALYAPHSRGSVSLQSVDPDVPLRIDQQLLSDPRDAQRMLMAARLGESLIADPALRDCFSEAYLLPRDPPLRLVNGIGLAGKIKALGASAVLGAPSTLRRAILSRAIAPGRLIVDRGGHSPISDDEILAASGGMFHPSGTCAIGAPDNPMAVVDPRGRVYGVQGLRVADASVMPRLPVANTNIPTLMIGERVADFMKADWRSA
jgi:5-(hydroxymethyl)furfural/furfural oxidase